MNYTNAFLIFLGIGAMSMMVMSVPYFHPKPSGILQGNPMTSVLWYKLAFLTHISMGLIAIASGPLQFISKIRQRRPRLHRYLGYVYGVAVLCSALSGLLIAQYAMGGIVTTLGFSLLSLLWLLSLRKSFMEIRRGRIAEHQKWMFFNYALTFAAITQRTLLLFAFLPFFSFLSIYRLSAWLPWMVNLFIAYLLLRKNRSQKENGVSDLPYPPKTP